MVICILMSLCNYCHLDVVWHDWIAICCTVSVVYGMTYHLWRNHNSSTPQIQRHSRGLNGKFPFHAKVKEMKKLKNARVKIVGGDPNDDDETEIVARWVNLSECVVRRHSHPHTNRNNSHSCDDIIALLYGYLSQLCMHDVVCGTAERSSLGAHVNDASAKPCMCLYYLCSFSHFITGPFS